MGKVIKEKNSFGFLFFGVVLGLAVLAAALCYGFITAATNNAESARRLEAGYVSELWELRDNLNEMENVSAKLMIATGKTDTVLYASELKCGAEAAAIALSKLPVTGEPIGLVNKVSDYATYLIQTVVSGKGGMDASANAETVYITVRTLNAAVEDILVEVEGGRKLSEGIELAFSAEGDKEESSVEYPELIYDGPFSDGRHPGCFKALEGLGELTESEAVLKFAETFSLTDVTVLGQSADPAAYEMQGYLGALPVYASMSVKGGVILNLTVSKPVDAVHLSEKDAERLAIEYAERIGYKDLTPVWYNEGSGIAYVNLAPEADGAVLYTDLVKVKIALDDGTVLGIEAKGYCLNHHDRAYRPVMSADNAAALVSPHLQVSSTRLCVVPEGEGETLCYEVAGEYKGLDYFVYLSALDGREVNILRVIDDSQGKLTV